MLSHKWDIYISPSTSQRTSWKERGNNYKTWKKREYCGTLSYIHDMAASFWNSQQVWLSVQHWTSQCLSWKEDVHVGHTPLWEIIFKERTFYLLILSHIKESLIVLWLPKLWGQISKVLEMTSSSHFLEEILNELVFASQGNLPSRAFWVL